MHLKPSPSAKRRPAIAMIELIFAIVIMGIAVMSAPSDLATIFGTKKI